MSFDFEADLTGHIVALEHAWDFQGRNKGIERDSIYVVTAYKTFFRFHYVAF